jgi:hypothetical protein
VFPDGTFREENQQSRKEAADQVISILTNSKTVQEVKDKLK